MYAEEPDKGQEAAARMERLFRRAVLATNDGIVVTDPDLPDNPIVYVNPAFERMTGYTSAEAVGRNCRFLQGPQGRRPTRPGRGARRPRGKARVQARGTEPPRNLRKDGSAFWHELHVSPVWGDDGGLENFVGMQTDVTGRIRAEEERERLREREREAAALTEERARVGAELHDRVTHSMATVRQNLDLYEVLRERDPEAARAKLERAREEARSSLETARDLSMTLRRPRRSP
ncbi:MAG: PAS domain S-box protein [Actinomycetota bacterium]|nr:PAS domain S-box protein [Actinomycetota bacterium]